MTESLTKAESRCLMQLVILDIVMPNTGGGETFDALNTISPSVPILFYSGYSIDGQASMHVIRNAS